jgi:predicted DNA-binding transcriptional regulator YafY
MSAVSRRLQILALLQAHPGISAVALASRLGVTERTTRRDIAQLRDLGYHIEGEAGRAGGYRLGPGREMPPLLLDADEVAAVAVGLRTAVAVDGLETAAVTAFAKLTRVVPAKWRTRLSALGEVESLPDQNPRRAGRDVLVALALACRSGEAVRIRHRRNGTGGLKPVEVQPYRVVAVRRRWYLVACPRGSSRWLVYGVDRVESAQPLGVRLDSPDPPPDAVAYVAEKLAHGPWRHRVRVRVHTSADLVRDLVDPTTATVADDGDTCELRFGTDDLDWAARWLTYLNLDFDVVEPEALTDHLRGLGGWLADRY